MDFGLAVRGHPSALMVTARNKLGSGEKTVAIGLSSQFVETARLKVEGNALDHNRSVAKKLVQAISASGFSQASAEPVSGGYLLRGVPVSIIDAFLRDWDNAEQSMTTQIPPIRNYIDVRKEDELGEWDIHIASLSAGEDCRIFDGWPVTPITRKILMRDLASGFLSIGGEKMRVSSRGVERIGIPEELAKEKEAEHWEKKKSLNYPGNIYRSVRTRPLFALYVVQIKVPEDPKEPIPANFPREPVIAWAISFPQSARPDKRVEYVINKVKQRELFGTADEDEDLVLEDE